MASYILIYVCSIKVEKPDIFFTDASADNVSLFALYRSGLEIVVYSLVYSVSLSALFR